MPAKRTAKKAKGTRTKPARTSRARSPSRDPSRGRSRGTSRRARTGPGAIPEGAYAHIELYSDDPQATQDFFAHVFGWKFQDASYGPGMTYKTYQTPMAPHGGIMDRKVVPMPVPPVVAYIKVNDVDATTRRIAKAGGKVLQEKMEVPNVGWFAVFEAPGGVVQALWEANPKFRP